MTKTLLGPLPSLDLSTIVSQGLEFRVLPNPKPGPKPQTPSTTPETRTSSTSSGMGSPMSESPEKEREHCIAEAYYFFWRGGFMGPFPTAVPMFGCMPGRAPKCLTARWTLKRLMFGYCQSGLRNASLQGDAETIMPVGDFLLAAVVFKKESRSLRLAGNQGQP